ncbi:hypothetical protein Q8A73_014515 [Channa argus]|nr:hypothetical protein Q8A73_014515 [Channa argus]
MQALALPVQKFFSTFKDNANTLFFCVVVLYYHTFENKFPCSCEPQNDFCAAYMLMPFFILTALMLSTDSQFLRAFRFTISQTSFRFACVLLLRILKALCMGLLWVASVLIDAEWYVCCQNPNTNEVAVFQCKNGKDLHQGTPIASIAEMKKNSRLYGMSLLLGLTVGVCLLSIWKCYGDGCCLECCHSKVQVHEMILEVGEDIVPISTKAKLKTMLEEKVNEYITERKWDMCSNAIEDVINKIEKSEDRRGDSDQENVHIQEEQV